MRVYGSSERRRFELRVVVGGYVWDDVLVAVHQAITERFEQLKAEGVCRSLRGDFLKAGDTFLHGSQIYAGKSTVVFYGFATYFDDMVIVQEYFWEYATVIARALRSQQVPVPESFAYASFGESHWLVDMNPKPGSNNPYDQYAQ